jgi:hypothetical protein
VGFADGAQEPHEQGEDESREPATVAQSERDLVADGGIADHGGSFNVSPPMESENTITSMETRHSRGPLASEKVCRKMP